MRMMFIEFPIAGSLRLSLLIMEWIFIITSFEISFIFLYRYFQQEKTLRNSQDLGFFSLFFGFSLMWFFFIIGDYYSSQKMTSPFLFWRQGSERALFLNIGYFTMIAAGFFLLYFIERYNIILFRRYLYTYIFSVCAILFLIVFFIDIRLTQPITYMFWTGFLSFFLIYLVRFIKKLKRKGLLLFGGMSFMLIGFLLTTDALIEVFGLEGRMIGAILQLISVVILSYFFMSLPPFSEFDWQEKIEALYIVNSSGICLLYKIFSNKKELMNEQLISAAILSINAMLKEITKTGESIKGISVIKKKTENVIIYQGSFVSGVLYTSEELNFPKLLLKEFVEKFEKLYQNILLNWNGDTNIFNPTEKIIHEIFLR
jgi:hypothetical protein